jgi:hypothetical protein
MRCLVSSRHKQEVVMWNQILLAVASAVFAALAEMLRPKKPRK